MKVFLLFGLCLNLVGAAPKHHADLERQYIALGCAVPSWQGDNYCDDENNNAGCDYDGGDCCGDDVNTTYCNQCQCLEPIATTTTPAPPTGCAVPSWKGDGYCDDNNNNAGCDYDGGDCCGNNVDTTYCNTCQCLDGGSGGGQNNDCAKIPSWMKSSLQGFDRIIDGETPPAPIPWQAHMRQGNPNGGFTYFCGGTILDEKTILTAAHCYHGKNLNAGNFFIAAGAIHVADGSQQTAFVDSITLHQSYNPNTIDNDIAILKLKTPLAFNDKVRRACLPDASFNPSGMGVASGWGQINNGQGTHNLQWVAKPVVTRDQCIRPFFSWSPSTITTNMICAGDSDGGESVCFGDSGGPLVVPKSSSDDTAIVLGAASFVSGTCGEQGFPSVFAYVIPYLNWILPKME